jgi:hypothetical protein
MSTHTLPDTAQTLIDKQPIRYVDTIGPRGPAQVHGIDAVGSGSAQGTTYAGVGTKEFYERTYGPQPGVASIVITTETNKPLPFKYGEEEILQELREYLLATYGQHYVGKDNIQLMDLIMTGDANEATGFLRWNAVKYALRFGRKGGRNTADLFKALHYAILLMHLEKKSTK